MNSLKVALTWVLLITQASCTPPPGHVPKPDNDKDPPKYEFGYDINDGKGGSQGHIETRDGIYALGKYYVNLPGGSDQKVDYFADDWGYHPLVEYKSSSHTGSSSTQFAFGEKAVAALSKSNPTVPSLDQIKAKSPVLVQPKPLVSIKSTLGIVSDPSQYNNEVYSTTTQSTPVDPSESGLVLTQPYPVQYEATNPQSTKSLSESSDFDSAPNYGHFESQRFSSLIQPEVVSSNYVDPPKYAYSSTASPQYAAVPNIGYESTTYRPEVTSAKSTATNDIQIVSYLADTNSAIDVTGKVSQSQEGSIRGAPVTHTISAFLVAEDDHKLEGNQINEALRQEIVSTTGAPKTLFKPIVVPDVTVGPVVSTEPPYESMSIVYKDSKFYKSRFPLISSAQYKYNTDKDDSSQRVELSTITPSLEPVLVTPKPTVNFFTSSDRILAPIQAAVTLSHSESTSDCDDATSIEQANTQDKEVYTTSIDIQKSIPYEIISKEQSNYNQNFNISYGNNFNYENADYPEVDYQTGDEVKYSPNSFLQQVIKSYQRLSNGNNGGYYQEQDRHINLNPSNTIPVQNQQYFVPNRLYYVYLQRFNPYVNRYAEQVGYNQYQTVPGYSSEHIEGIQYSPTQSSDVRILTPQEQIYQPYPSHTDSINNNYYANQGRDDGRQGVDISQVRQNANYKNVEASNFDNVKSEFVVPSAEFEKSIEKSQTSFAQSQGQSGNAYGNGEALHQVVNTANQYQNKEEFANNLANLYATQLNALRSLESENSNNNYEKENPNVQYDHNSGEYLGENKEANTYTGRESILSNTNANTVTKIENSAYLTPQQNEKVKFVEQKQDITRKLSDGISQAILEHASHVASPEIHTQIVEKPVPVEVTKIVEKPVPVPHPVPVTKVVHVEKPVAVPYPVTKLVAVDRPVAVPEPYPVPHPVPLPYEVPHPIGVPVPHYIPYPHVIPVPYKEYHPVYIYTKKERLEHLRHSNQKQSSDQRKPFIPSQQVFTSQYPPRTYHVSGYFKGPNNRGQGRKLCIEYGGFKPPLIPSVQIDDAKSNGYPSTGKH